MADRVKIARIEDLNPLVYGVEGDSIGEADQTVVSHTNPDGENVAKRVSMATLGEYIANYLKESKRLKFDDLADGDDIMKQIFSDNQINTFTDKVYTKTEDVQFSFDSASSKWKTEDIEVDEDCTCHFHAQIRQAGAIAITDLDTVELQIKNASGEWTPICSQPRTAASGILEMDYHAKLQAGVTLRMIAVGHGTTTQVDKSNAFGVGILDCTFFSNDTPFISSIKTKYVSAGSNSSVATPYESPTDQFIVNKRGVVWMEGTYTQSNNLETIASSRPYQVPTVYAQGRKPNGDVLRFGSTEASIPQNSAKKTTFKFNNLYHYVDAAENSPVSITISTDTALYDKDLRTSFNGLANPTKITYCSELADFRKRMNIQEDVEISSLAQLTDAQWDDTAAATFMFAPGYPFWQAKSKSGTTWSNIVTKLRTQGTRRFNQVNFMVGTQDSGRPYYIRYGTKQFTDEENLRDETYAFGFSDGNTNKVNIVLKSDVVIKPQIVLPYNNITAITTADWKDWGVPGITSTAEGWDKFKDMISSDIGDHDPSAVWGAFDCRVQVLSDNVSEIGIYPEKVDDYNIADSKFCNGMPFGSSAYPAEWYGDYPFSLTGFVLNRDIPLGIRSSAFAFCVNLREAKIPLNCTFNGDHTFRMQMGYDPNDYKHLSAIISASPYGITYGQNRPAVDGTAKQNNNVVSAWYKQVTKRTRSRLSSVEFAVDDETHLSVSPTNVVHVEGGVLRNTFVNCHELLSANIQATDATVLEGTFINCEKLSDVIVPTGCTTLGKNAFWATLALRRISIPTTVVSADDRWIAQSGFNYRDVNYVSWGPTTIKGDASWFSKKNLSSSVLTDVSVAVDGNRGLSSVSNDGRDQMQYCNVDYLSGLNYEIDIRLSGATEDYYSNIDGQSSSLDFDKIHQEISATINALNKCDNSTAPMQWFPTLKIYNFVKDKTNDYRCNYLPPRGRVYHITDKDGKYINKGNGKKLVYNHMLMLRDFDFRKVITNLPGTPTPTKGYCFVGNGWYTFNPKTENYRDAVNKSTFSPSGTNPYISNAGDPQLFAYRKEFLTWYNENSTGTDSEWYYGPSSRQTAFKKWWF